MEVIDSELYDRFEELAEELAKDFQKIKAKASALAVEKNKEVLEKKSGAYNAGTLVKLEIQKETERALERFQRKQEEILSEIEDVLTAYNITLSKSDVANINQKVGLISNDLIGQSNILATDVQEILLNGLGRGIKESVLIAQLTELYPSYKQNAFTIVNTGLQRIYSDTTTEKYQQLGYEFYTWAGPQDELTRDNPCRRFGWKVFTAAELPSLRSIKMRLYNCRHSIMPITPEMAKDMPRGDISAYTPYTTKKGLTKQKK